MEGEKKNEGLLERPKINPWTCVPVIKRMNKGIKRIWRYRFKS